MRRIPLWSLEAALAVILIATPLAMAHAAETMTFRPVPPESAAQTAQQARESAKEVRDQVRALLDVLAVVLAQPADDVLGARGVWVLALAVDDLRFARPITLCQARDRRHHDRV